MKRFMKTCAVIAAVLCLLGLLLGVTASSLRGREAISEVVEKVTGGWVHINLDDIKNWGITVGKYAKNATDIIGSMGVDYDLNEHTIFEHSHKIYKGDVAKYCPGDKVEKLEVAVGGCLFETKASGDGKFYIEADNVNKFQGYVEGGTLYIKATDGAKNWSRTGSCSIILYVPRDCVFKEVEMEMGAGVMEISDLRSAGEISLEVGAGKIVIDNISSPDLELEIGAGEIQLKGMEVGELSAGIGMGNFTAAGSVDGDAKIECSMGNVELTLFGGEKSFNYSIECSMGSVDLGGERYSGLAKEKKIQNGAAKTMEIECSMGNVRVSFDN